MENQQKETRAGGKDPQPIPGQPTPDRQKPEIPEMPDKEVPEMPVRQTDTPTQAPVTSEADRRQQQQQTTPTPQQPSETSVPSTGTQERTREDDHMKEQEQPLK